VRKNTFLGGAAILAAAGIICRLLGVVIRIPLTNIVGNYGMGLYQMVFPLYSLLLIISSAGIPVAISRMVAKDKEQGKNILINSIILLAFIGLIISALFAIFSAQIASFQGNRDVWVIYLAIAPSVFLVCIISAFRGYFQGLQNMIPTATSQIIEQLVKAVFAITLALVFVKASVLWAVFGTILAVTISESAALIFLIITFVVVSRKKGGAYGGERPVKKAIKFIDFSLMWNILKQSAPITLMSAIFPLILVLDSLFIINMLKSSGTGGEEATQLYGIQSGAVHTLVNLPAVLGAAVATAIVPQVSALLKQDKTEELREKMALAVKVTLIISVFFTAFYIAFADKILDLLYHGAFRENKSHFTLAANLLRVESALILFMSISSVFTAMLQGAGRSRFPLYALLAGGAVKIAFQFALIKTPLNIYAVSIGNVLCFTIASIMNTVFALRTVKIKKEISFDLLKMAIVTAAFCFCTFMVSRVMPTHRFFVILSGALTLFIYALLIILSGVIKFNKNKLGNIIQ
jgi:stage V sporulation protein B